MKWIGITGGIATGKSSVTKVLRSLGHVVIDADEVSHAVTAAGRPAVGEILRVFGPSVIAPDGSLDRRALGQLVFGHPDQIKKLEAIVHPLIVAEVAAERKRLESVGTKVAFYDVPLLYEKNMESQFDAVILIWSTEEQQLARLVLRNKLSFDEARARLQSQLPIASKRGRTPYVIDNSGSLAELGAEVERALAALLGPRRGL